MLESILMLSVITSNGRNLSVRFSCVLDTRPDGNDLGETVTIQKGLIGEKFQFKSDARVRSNTADLWDQKEWLIERIDCDNDIDDLVSRMPNLDDAIEVARLAESILPSILAQVQDNNSASRSIMYRTKDIVCKTPTTQRIW